MLVIPLVPINAADDAQSSTHHTNLGVSQESFKLHHQG